MTATDLSVLWEAVIMIALPFCVVAAGAFLRRKFARPAAGPEGAAAEPGSRKAARVAGQLLFWGGIFAIVFTFIVFLNFKGIL